jgi:hypothetical protein
LLPTILVVVVDLIEKRELDAHFEIANSATTPTTPRALLSTDPGENNKFSHITRAHFVEGDFQDGFQALICCVAIVQKKETKRVLQEAVSGPRVCCDRVSGKD